MVELRGRIGNGNQKTNVGSGDGNCGPGILSGDLVIWTADGGSCLDSLRHLPPNRDRQPNGSGGKRLGSDMAL